MTNQTMQAWTAPRYGGPDVLSCREVPRPTPGQGQVLVEVHASSVNAADWYLLHGTPLPMRVSSGLRRPKAPIPGLDVAGVVVEVGAGVTRFAEGDAVFGDVGGGWATHTVADEAKLARVADGQSVLEAGGVPVAGLTALQGLRDVASVGPGTSVLVFGASGGVGTFAVQVARALGAEVSAVCSTAKVDQARALGAHTVIDYTTNDPIEQLTAERRRFDVVFDVAGTRGVRERARLLAPGGICVHTGGPRGGPVLGPIPSLARAVLGGLVVPGRFRSFVATSDGADAAALAEMIAGGQVRTVVESVTPFAQLPSAVAAFGDGHAAGKHLLAIA